MKIQTELNKPHKKHMSTSREFAISFTIIKSSVTIVYIGKEFECMVCNSNISIGSDYS